jgi:hypothetical protein
LRAAEQSPAAATKKSSADGRTANGAGPAARREPARRP